MKKLVHLALLIIIAALSFTSCKKFLDKEPLSAATDENFWKNEKEANSAVAGNYALLRQALTDGYAFFNYGDYPSDEFRTSLGGEDWPQISNIQWNLSVPPTSTYRPMYKLRRYDNFYRIIDQANRCIRFIPNIPSSEFSNPDMADDARKALIGEAYFLRAFSYFYMGRVWGGVPIVDEGSKDLSAAVNLPRATPEEVMNQARTDVKKAIEMLSWDNANSSDKAVRANKGVAYALLAHLEAWTGKYAECAAAATEVINSGQYHYVPMSNYLSIWKGQSQEGIFEISANSPTEGSGRSIATFTLKAPYLATNRGTQVETPLDEFSLKAKFPDPADLRIQKAFAFYNSTDPNCIKYSNILYLTTDGNGNKGNPISQNNMVVFRLSDIVLLKAEALAATGINGEARTLLNEIRNKALPGNDYTGTDDGLFEEIIRERSRELFLEGHRFYDLVRLARKKGIYNFGGARMNSAEFMAGKYYWPLDPTLLTLNPKLKQTDYWKDKM